MFIYMSVEHSFRLIPGDLCQSTSESEKLLRQVEKVCTGHEKDAGFYPENKRGGVSSTHSACVTLLPSRLLTEQCLEDIWGICDSCGCLGNSSYLSLLLVALSEEQVSVSSVCLSSQPLLPITALSFSLSLSLPAVMRKSTTKEFRSVTGGRSSVQMMTQVVMRSLLRPLDL